MEKFLIIPDLCDIETSLSIAGKYGFGFEYNDFYIPDILDDEEKTEEYIKTYVDGVQLFYYNPDNYSAGRNERTWPFNKPFQLKLNLAWGGDWGGMYGVDESCLPATYEIDYVRVFQLPE